MQKTFTFRHTTVAYEDVCEGPRDTVVFLHGFAEDGTVWKHQVAALRDKYRLLIPDLPGSGLSPEPLSDPSMETFAELVHALLRHEAASRCCMIGHSMGGYITLAFAEKYPEVLRGFGLFHSTAFPDSDEKKQTRRKSITFIREHGAGAFLRQSTPNLFASRFKREQPGEVEALLQRVEGFDPTALTGYYEAMMARPDRTEVLAKSRGPVLLVIGKQDNAVPLAESLRLTNLAETSFVYILDQVAHMGMWEAVPEANKTLQEYLGFVYKE